MIGAVVGFLLGRSLGAELGRLLGRSLSLLEPRAEPSAKLARVGGFGLPAAMGAPLAVDTQAHATTNSATCHASHRICNRNAARRTRARLPRRLYDQWALLDADPHKLSGKVTD